MYQKDNGNFFWSFNEKHFTYHKINPCKEFALAFVEYHRSMWPSPQTNCTFFSIFKGNPIYISRWPFFCFFSQTQTYQKLIYFLSLSIQLLCIFKINRNICYVLLGAWLLSVIKKFSSFISVVCSMCPYFVYILSMIPLYGYTTNGLCYPLIS